MTSEAPNLRKGPSTLTILVPILVILGVAWAALSFLKSQVGNNKTAPHAIELKVGSTLPDMVLTRVDGSTMKLSESGAKVALINFWATWCEACMDELPSLIKLHEAYKPQGLEILGINLDEKPAKAIASLSGEFSLKFPNFMDHDGRLGDAFDVHAIPFTLVIDSSRKILETAAGDRNWMDPAFTTRLKGWLGQADQPKR